jgi:hypothetical protein
MQKNRRSFIYTIILSICAVVILLPFCAEAYTVPTTLPQYLREDVIPAPYPGIHVCPGNLVNPPSSPFNAGIVNPSLGFTSRLIPCIRDSVIFATLTIVKTFSAYIYQFLLAAFTLAIVTYGVLVLSGSGGNPTQAGIILLLKISSIMLVLSSFDVIYPQMLSSVEGLLDIIAAQSAAAPSSGGLWRNTNTSAGTGNFCQIIAPNATNPAEGHIMTVWNVLDCYLDLLVGGIFSPFSLESGLIGFIIGITFSSVIGAIIGLAAFYMLITILSITARSVYIFLTSYIAFSFMAILSPLIIPCILFKSTKGYFDSWLRITFSFMLQPVFAFGYLIMFLTAVDVTILNGEYSLNYAIAGDASKISTNPNFRIGKWVNDNGMLKVELKDKENIALTMDGAIKEFSNYAPTNGLTDPSHTSVEGVQAKIPALANVTAEFPFGKHFFGDGGGLINYFQQGLELKTFQWEELARVRNFSAYNLAHGDAAKMDKLTMEFKIKLFTAFISALVMMYLFYSLIDYIPFIGTGASNQDPGLALAASRKRPSLPASGAK